MTAIDAARDQTPPESENLGESSRRPPTTDRSESTLDAVPSGGWYKDAIIYELHVRALSRRQRRRHRGLQGADRKARLPAVPRRHRAVAACRSIPRRCAMTATTSPTTDRSIRRTARCAIFAPSCAKRTDAA